MLLVVHRPQRVLPSGNSIKSHEEFWSLHYSLCSHLNVLTFFPLARWMLSFAFLFFIKYVNQVPNPILVLVYWVHYIFELFHVFFCVPVRYSITVGVSSILYNA